MSGRASARALLVAVGSAERGDDAIGRRIAERIAPRLPAGAALIDCGADPLALLDHASGHDLLLALDAAAPLGAPGRIHRLDLSDRDLPREWLYASSHAIGLAESIALARELGVLPRRVIVYAVEGERFERGAPMTPAVEGAVESAGRRVLAEIRRALNPEGERLRCADGAPAAGTPPGAAR